VECSQLIDCTKLFPTVDELKVWSQNKTKRFGSMSKHEKVSWLSISLTHYGFHSSFYLIFLISFICLFLLFHESLQCLGKNDKFMVSYFKVCNSCFLQMRIFFVRTEGVAVWWAEIVSALKRAQLVRERNIEIIDNLEKVLYISADVHAMSYLAKMVAPKA
jgi:hypothetical protein